jgi:hypothetical protein
MAVNEERATYILLHNHNHHMCANQIPATKRQPVAKRRAPVWPFLHDTSLPDDDDFDYFYTLPVEMTHS